jgi:ADP-ribosylglycohydrolase
MKIKQETLRRRFMAVIIGHAVADALGVPVEFCSREELDENPITKMEGFGTYDVPLGSWSDDTSMSLCALDAIRNGRDHIEDTMKNFVKWYEYNEYTPDNYTFDVGNTCSTAIERYESGTAPLKCGLDGERSCGNGSLMRINPSVLYIYG